MVVQDPCSVCKKCVRVNDRAIQCDICNFWVHIKCNNITPTKYKELMHEDNKEPFYCILCINKEVPFANTNSNLKNLNLTLSKNEKEKIKQI